MNDRPLMPWTNRVLLHSPVFYQALLMLNFWAEVFIRLHKVQLKTPCQCDFLITATTQLTAAVRPWYGAGVMCQCCQEHPGSVGH